MSNLKCSWKCLGEGSVESELSLQPPREDRRKGQGQTLPGPRGMWRECLTRPRHFHTHTHTLIRYTHSPLLTPSLTHTCAGKSPLSPTSLMSQTHTFTHTHSCFQPHIHAFRHTHTHSHLLTCSHTPTHTHGITPTHMLTRSHPHTHMLTHLECLTLMHTHSHAHTHSCSHPLTPCVPMHTHSHLLSPSLSHSRLLLLRSPHLLVTSVPALPPPALVELRSLTPRPLRLLHCAPPRSGSPALTLITTLLQTPSQQNSAILPRVEGSLPHSANGGDWSSLRAEVKRAGSLRPAPFLRGAAAPAPARF